MPELIIIGLVGVVVAGGIFKFLRVPAHLLATSAKRPERVRDYQRVMGGAVALLFSWLFYHSGYPEGAVFGFALLVVGGGAALWGVLVLLTAK